MQMKKIIFYISIVFTFISCINNQSDATHVKIFTTPISKIKMTLSAFGVESDNFPSIDVYIDFEKDSSYCHKSFYNPAYKDSIYILTPAELKNILDLLKNVDLQKIKKDYKEEKTDQPSSTTIIYTAQGKFTINDYGLIADAPLSQLYKIVYKF